MSSSVESSDGALWALLSACSDVLSSKGFLRFKVLCNRAAAKGDTKSLGHIKERFGDAVVAVGQATRIHGNDWVKIAHHIVQNDLIKDIEFGKTEPKPSISLSDAFKGALKKDGKTCKKLVEAVLGMATAATVRTGGLGGVDKLGGLGGVDKLGGLGGAGGLGALNGLGGLGGGAEIDPEAQRAIYEMFGGDSDPLSATLMSSIAANVSGEILQPLGLDFTGLMEMVVGPGGAYLSEALQDAIRKGGDHKTGFLRFMDKVQEFKAGATIIEHIESRIKSRTQESETTRSWLVALVNGLQEAVEERFGMSKAERICGCGRVYKPEETKEEPESEEPEETRETKEPKEPEEETKEPEEETKEPEDSLD